MGKTCAQKYRKNLPDIPGTGGELDVHLLQQYQ